MEVGENARRALHRLTLFAEVVPADAVVALAATDRKELAAMIQTGILVATGSGFRIAAEARAVATALPPTADESKDDTAAHARWLLATIASMQVAQDTRVAFDLLEPLLPDVHVALKRLG